MNAAGFVLVALACCVLLLAIFVTLDWLSVWLGHEHPRTNEPMRTFPELLASYRKAWNR